MATITTKELKRVLAISKNIKEVNSLPILSYVKLSCSPNASTFTKTNLNSFVVADVECITKKTETFIIDEKTLVGAVSNAKGEEITFTQDKKNVIIDDGVRPIKSQTEDEINFPGVKLPAGDGVELNRDVITAMVKAKSQVLKKDDTMLNWLQYVHSKKLNGKSTILGTNAKIGYFKFFDEELPEFTIDTDIIHILDQYPVLNYSTAENYDYFTCVGVAWGFVKSEVKCADIGQVLSSLKSEDSFIVAKNDVVNFCNLSIDITRSAIDSIVDVSDAGSKIKFFFADLSEANSVPEEIAVDEKTFSVSPYRFNPTLMTTLLKPIPAEKIKMSRVKNTTVVTADEYQNYLGFIADVQ